MTAGVKAGVDIELGPLELAIGAIADVSGEVQKLRKAVLRDSNPIHLTLIQATLGTGASPMLVVITQDAPAPGRMWYVQRVGIFGSDGHTTLPGVVADIYAGPGEQNTGIDYSSQIYSGLAVPSIIEEGRFHNPMSPNDQIYALVYGVALNQQIVLTALVSDYPLASQVAMFQ